jgi:hypothetical protein
MVFAKFLRLEISRLFRRLKIIILSLFIVFSVVFIQSGIDQYKNSLKESKRFQEFEKTKIKHFQHYLQYGTYGFRVLYIPGPLGALFSNSGVIPRNLHAFIDSGERMKIYEQFTGQNAFSGYTSIFLNNITGFLLLFGSILALFYGWEAFLEKEFIKLLINITGSRKKIFWSIMGARVIIIFAGCLLITFITSLLFLVNGLNQFDWVQLFLYFLVLFLMLILFLVAGLIAGASDRYILGLVSTVLIWFLFVLIIPSSINKIVFHRAGSMVSVYEMEMDKLKLMMLIEKKAAEQAGKIDPQNPNTEIRRKLHEMFWKNEFQQIFNHEKKVIQEMKALIALQNNLSMIFPTSFFLSVNNEICGRGYGNLITFYEHILKLKKGFIQYFAEKTFFANERDIKPYLQENSNIFYAPGLLPVGFIYGLFINIVWLATLLFLSWLSYNRMMQRKPKFTTHNENVKKPTLEELKKNKITLVLTENPFRLRQLLLRLKIEKASYLFVPKPTDLLGGVKVNILFSFFSLPLPGILNADANQYCDSLESDKKALVLIEIIKQFQTDFLIFNDFLAGLSDPFKNMFNEFLKARKKGSHIAYFSNSIDAAKYCDNVRNLLDEDR